MSFWIDAARVRKALELSSSADAELHRCEHGFADHTGWRAVRRPGGRALRWARVPGGCREQGRARRRGQSDPGKVHLRCFRTTWCHDTLQALGRLGRVAPPALKARVCAVTGSNGKTTTKEMLRAVLGTKYKRACHDRQSEQPDRHAADAAGCARRCGSAGRGARHEPARAKSRSWRDRRAGCSRRDGYFRGASRRSGRSAWRSEGRNRTSAVDQTGRFCRGR